MPCVRVTDLKVTIQILSNDRIKEEEQNNGKKVATKQIQPWWSPRWRWEQSIEG
jgi:hypothetical protein